ncbi:succinic semialdehyde dehydrogenase [Aggregatilineales bacterium SYSU G02658]
MTIQDAAPPQTEQKRTIDVHNPITGAVIGQITAADEADVQAAVERARVAQVAWGALDVRERARLMRTWQDKLWARREEIINTIWNEAGKPYGAAFTECVGVDNQLAYYTSRAHRILRPKKRQTLIPFVMRGEVVYKPYGVVGVISAWNYPYFLPMIDSTAALLAGNAVILKASEITPFTSRLAVSIAHEAGIPRDVFQIVEGDGQTGKALVDHVDYVAFTGSTATGRKIAVQAAGRLIPYTLELGGKDPAIVMADADLDMAASRVITGAWENAGQACLSIERVYVEAPIYDAFLQKVLDYAKQFKFDASKHAYMGTMINQRELERSKQHLEDAVAKGAKVLWGGQPRPDLGPQFFEPTVLVDVDHSMTIMREETFGPMLPIMKVNSVEEAIRLANDTDYGLGATVYSKDFAKAREVCLRLNAGETNVNRFVMGIGTPDVPSGGMKQSGIGRRNGPEGLLKYTQMQAVMIDTMRGQRPGLNVLDPVTKITLLFLRRLRRVFPWV